MILASTFAFFMVVSFCLMLVDSLDNSETQTLNMNPELRTVNYEPSILELSFQVALAEIFEYLDDVHEIETVFDMLVHPELYFHQPLEDFEDAIFHASELDFSALAASLLAKPKPQRDARGRFKARRTPSQVEGTVNRTAPIPSGFSFFKTSYQSPINKLIYKVQQFLAAPCL